MKPSAACTPTKPKVLIVDFITTFGGVQRVMANMVPEIRRYVDVAYIDALEDEGSRTVFERAGVPLARLAVWSRRQALGFDRSLFRKALVLAVWGPAYLAYAFRLARYARHHGFRAIYTNSKKGLMVCTAAGLLAHVPVIYHCHGLNGPEDVGAAYRSALQRCGAVIAVSQDVKRKLLGAGIPDELIHVVYNGINPHELRAAADRYSGALGSASAAAIPSPKCLVACNLQEGKGVHVAIEALRLLKTRGMRVQLLIAGDVPRGGDLQYRDRLQNMVQAYDLQSQVHFLGWRNDLPAVMKSSDILLIPSIVEESFGMVAAEAMALGKPVIASEIGGLPEVVRDGQTGFLFEPGDAEALAERIWQLASDTVLYERFGKEASHWVASQFTIERQARGISEIVTVVVEGAG